MYSPVGLIGDAVGEDGDADRTGTGGTGGRRGGGRAGGTSAPRPQHRSAPPTGSAEDVASLQTLTDAPPIGGGGRAGQVPVPWLTSLVIGVSVAFTVVFGIVPEPILDFAHQATLLFT